MDEKTTKNYVQIRCPYCGHNLQIRVVEANKVKLSFRCPSCKRVGEIILQDINSQRTIAQQ